MPKKRPGLRTGSVLRLIMADYGLSRSDIAGITSRAETSVDKWLSGDNRIPEDCISKITDQLGLCATIFSGSIKELQPKPAEVLTDDSIIIKTRTGFQIIINLTKDQLHQLIRIAGDMAIDYAPSTPGDDPPSGDDRQPD